MDWQREAITEFYGRMRKDEPTIRQYQYLYLEIPKKNGKSELSAGLGVYHLFADGEVNGEVYVVASDKENASIVFRVAKHMIENCPSLKKRCRIVDSKKEIFDKISGSMLKVLSSEAYSKHGYKPSCVIFDELHAQRNRELWDIMTFGSGDAREQPVWIVLTTAGDDPDRKSIGWEVHEKALSILKYRQGKRGEKYYDNPHWLPIIYGLGLYEDEDELKQVNIFDEKVWKQCNPSIGKTVKLSTIRAEAEEAKRSEAMERLFRWLRLNQWIAVHSIGWIPLTIYDKTQFNVDGMHWKEVAQLLKGKKCFGGVDLSKSTDLTGFVLVFPPQEGLEKWVALATGWIPLDDIQAKEKRDHVNYRDWIRAGFMQGCEGDVIDYTQVSEFIVSACNDYDVKMIGFDPHLGATIMQQLQKELAGKSTDVVEIPQGIRHISPPMKELERLIRSHKMLHIHNTALRSCFGNMRCIVDDNENVKPTKKRSTGRIDIAVAWIIAFATAMLEPKQDLAEAVSSGKWSL